MEVLAIGASIAGLLSLAAQCITRVEEVHKIHSDLSQYSVSANSFIKAVNGLLKTLHDVEVLMKAIERHPTINHQHVPLTSLQSHLNDCNANLGSWIRRIRECRTKYMFVSSKVKSFDYFWRTINKDSIEHELRELEQRQIEISVSLNIVGRCVYTQ